MKTRKQIDPELHMLRTVARLLADRARNEVESARFNLFVAFEEQDSDKARRWLGALRVASLANRNDFAEAYPAVAEALDRIEEALGGAS